MHPAKHRMRETTAESDHNLLSQSVIPRTVDDIVIRIRCMIETSQRALLNPRCEFAADGIAMPGKCRATSLGA